MSCKAIMGRLYWVYGYSLL